MKNLAGKSLWKSERIAQRFGVPRRFRSARLDNIPTSLPYLPKLVDFIKHLPHNLQSGIGLYLYGPQGHGKTAAACIVLRYVARLGELGYFTTCRAIPSTKIDGVMFDEIRTQWDWMLSCPCLVLDELNFDKSARWLPMIEDLVRGRSNDCLSTIITSNIGPSELSGVEQKTSDGKPIQANAYPALANLLRESVISIKVEGVDFRAAVKDAIHRRKT